MKGFTRDKKFVPMTDYKKVTRKSRNSQTISEGIRLRRDKKIPVYNTKVNWDDKRKPFKMWIVKHPEGSDVVKGSVTIVMAEHYGQAIDDYITIWNKENRMNRKIGYPVVQGTADKNFRYKRESKDLHTLFQHNWDESSIRLRKELIKNAISTRSGIHADPSMAIKSWSDQPLEKLPISLRNTIGIEVTFGSPKLRNEFWKHKQ